jgi:hypothetical protein
MRNSPALSTLAAVLIAIAVVGVLGFLLASPLSGYVNPLDPNTSLDLWRTKFQQVVAYSAVACALLSALWLVLAHGGRGHGTKSGEWILLLGLSMLISAILVWLIPPNLREGLPYPLGVMALLSGLGFWLSTLFMTPDQYRYTPWFAWALFGKRRA